MPRFAANLSFLFTELPFLDRFAAAAAAGFKAVEFMFPYEWPAGEIVSRLREHKLQLVLFNTAQGRWEAGERGIMGLANRELNIDAALIRAIEYAHATGCRQLHAMAGLEQHGATLDTLAANVRRAADTVAPYGIDILIEPINTRDMPGYVLSKTDDALDVLAAVDRPNAGVQFDFYHRYVMHGEVERGFAQALPSIGHIQIASPPDRGEPGSGELDYARIFELIDRSGYTGWVGCEYKPRGGTTEGLAWLEAARA